MKPLLWKLFNDLSGALTLGIGIITNTSTNTVAPALTGTGVVASSVSLSNGTWLPTPDNYEYKWYLNGVEVVGATTNSYTPLGSDIGKELIGQVRAIKNSIPSNWVNTTGLIITQAADHFTPSWVSSSTGYLTYDGTDASVGEDSDNFETSFIVKGLDQLPASARYLFSVNGRGWVQIYSTGVLAFQVNSAAPAVLGVYATSSSVKSSGRWIFHISLSAMNTATPVVQISRAPINDAGVMTGAWETLTGSWTTGPTQGIIDHTRQATGPDYAFLAQITSNVATYSWDDGAEIASIWMGDDTVHGRNIFAHHGYVVSPASITNSTWLLVGDDLTTGVNPGSGPNLVVNGSIGNINAATVPFPGAIGPGSASLGAYTSTNTPTIVHVTNLNNTGAGSLRAALTGGSDRLVVFDVGGNFTLSSEIIMLPRITVAGETAPEPVTILKSRIQPTTDNVITGIRIRPGDDSGGQEVSERDACIIPAGANRVMVAYSSFCWGPDEIVGGWSATGAGRYQNITFQDNMVFEGFVSASHENNIPYPGERHAFPVYFGAGASADGGRNILLARNLIMTGRSRMPAFAWASDFVVAENVIADWQNEALVIYSAEATAKFDILNNYFKNGPSTGSSIEGRRIRNTSNTGTMGVVGNYWNGSSNNTVDAGAGTSSGTPQCTAVYVPTLTAPQAETYVVSNAGAKSNNTRDSIDQRAMDAYVATGGSTSGPGATGNTSNFRDFDDYNANLNSPARTDTNGDGIYNAYETAMGVSTGTLSPHALINASTQGLNSRWNGHRQSTHQTYWLRNGSIDAA